MQTKSLILAALFALFGATSFAQAPAAGASATATCKDGTSYTGVKKGACKGHKGVKSWDTAAAGATGAAAAAPAAATHKASSKTAAMPAAAAPGGGAGKVWVNTSSKTYHCEGDKYYGKTKAGEYMSEADAKAQGDHPSHGKACAGK
ncbi:MAG: hypothetical protein EPN61_12680 [Burkholderiaceae bacterium]|nr:MAG: hypothetical protein EPN61_12680 [Burkholderiaceae bacterium]